MYFMHRRSAASGSITVVRPGGEFVSSKSGLELVLHATGGSGDRVVDALLRAGDVCAAVALSVFRSGVRCTDEASASPPLSDLAHNFRRRGSLAYITKKKKEKTVSNRFGLVKNSNNSKRSSREGNEKDEKNVISR